MSSSSEKLSRLVSKLGYHFPDTAPTVGNVMVVKTVTPDNVEIGFSPVSVPDPIKEITYDNATTTVTLTTVGGATFDVDIGAVDTDENKFITSVADSAEDIIAFTFNDGSSITYSPTRNDNKMSLKADTTTKVVSKTTQLKVKNPTLKDDVELSLETGTDAGDLVVLEAASTLPAAILANMGVSGGFIKMPTPYNPASGAAPAKPKNEMIFITKDGTMDYFNLDGVFSNAAPVHVGDILFYETEAPPTGLGVGWHLFTRAQTKSLAASAITTTAVGTPTLGANVQQVINSLESRKVPSTRKLKSSNLNELSINGLVEADLSADVTIALKTNVANGILKLDAGNKVPLSLIPISAFEYHGVHDPTTVISAKRPADADGVVRDWRSGDILEMSKDSTGNAAFQFVPVGKTALENAPLLKGAILTFDGTKWIETAPRTHVTPLNVFTTGMLRPTNQLPNIVPVIAPAHEQLTGILQAINDRAVWITGDQTVAGDKTFSDNVQAGTFAIGASGTEYTFPASRALTSGHTLVTDASGVLTWSELDAKHVSMTLATVTGTNVQDIIKNLFDDVMLVQTPKVTKELHKASGTAGGAGIKLADAEGVIEGDGATTNQINNVIFDEGVI